MILNQFWADYGRMHQPATVVPLLPRILKHSPNTETKLSEFQIQIEVRCTLILTFIGLSSLLSAWL